MTVRHDHKKHSAAAKTQPSKSAQRARPTRLESDTDDFNGPDLAISEQDVKTSQQRAVEDLDGNENRDRSMMD